MSYKLWGVKEIGQHEHLNSQEQYFLIMQTLRNYYCWCTKLTHETKHIRNNVLTEAKNMHMLHFVIFLTVSRTKCCAWKTWAVAFAISSTGSPFAATHLKLLAALSNSRQLRPIRDTHICFSHPQFDRGGNCCMVTVASPQTWPAWKIACSMCCFRAPFVIRSLFLGRQSSRASSTLHVMLDQSYSITTNCSNISISDSVIVSLVALRLWNTSVAVSHTFHACLAGLCPLPTNAEQCCNR